MTQRVVLHIGAMKTGTTYLQRLLTANGRELGEHGVMVPGRSWQAGVHDLMDGGDSPPGRWDALVDEVRRHDADVAVLSHEFLSFASGRTATALAGSFVGLDLDVVLTVRDAARTLPAQWHTFARNRGSMTWPEYVASAAGPRTKPWENTFVRSQRVGWTLRTWGDAVGADRLRVVTNPTDAAPDLLWQRFATAAGIDPAWATAQPQPANPSVGYATAHLFCLLHQRGLGAGLRWRQVRRLVRRISDDAAGRPPVGGRPPLDEAALGFAARWNAHSRAALTEMGVPVTGDLDDLPTSYPASLERPMRLPSDDDVIVAAEAAARTLAASRSDEPRAGWADVDAATDDLTRLLVAAVRRERSEDT